LGWFSIYVSVDFHLSQMSLLRPNSLTAWQIRSERPDLTTRHLIRTLLEIQLWILLTPWCCSIWKNGIKFNSVLTTHGARGRWKSKLESMNWIDNLNDVRIFHWTTLNRLFDALETQSWREMQEQEWTESRWNIEALWVFLTAFSSNCWNLANRRKYSSRLDFDIMAQSYCPCLPRIAYWFSSRAHTSKHSPQPPSHVT